MNSLAKTDNDNILRLPEVIQKTGLGKSTIYRRIRVKTFPSQVDLGGDIVGWLESDVQGWIKSRPRRAP